MTTGDRLRELREAAGLTLEQAGKIAGTSKQSTSQIEKGVTKVPGGLFLYRWSKHYNVNLEWLITGKGDRRPAPSQAQRPDLLILANAMSVLQNLARIKPERAVLLTDPAAILAAYDEVSRNPSQAFDLAGASRRMAAWHRGRKGDVGMERGRAVGAG